MVRPNKKFLRALTIQQVGAKPVYTKRGTLFKLGGGIFTGRQVVASRVRWGRMALPKVKKGTFEKATGLK